MAKTFVVTVQAYVTIRVEAQTEEVARAEVSSMWHGSEINVSDPYPYEGHELSPVATVYARGSSISEVFEE